ncbi:MAG TPA: DUF6665 family protein [Longimicrobium sp.]|jgi:hypothetical protein
MVFRKPRNLPVQPGSGGFDVLEYELRQEMAATLARLGRRLDAALRELEAFDASRRDGRTPAAGDASEREALVAAAGEALWYYVVQREVCGIGGTDAMLRELRVSREVQLRMGFFPKDRGR